jgi:hypothetical protein
MKVVGIVLLVLLGLLLLLLLLVLFVPYTYRVAGSCHAKKLQLRGSVYGFAGLLGAGVETRDGSWTAFLRILGVKFHPGSRTTKGRKVEPETVEPVQEPKSGDSRIMDSGPVDSGPVDSGTGSPEGKPGFWQKITGFPGKCRRVWRRLVRAVRSFGATAHRIVAFMTDGENQQSLRSLGGRLFRLLRCLTPRKMKLTMTFSTGSPDTTGQLLGLLALFPAAYRHRWNITPDFTAEEGFVEADFDVRGHVFGIQLLCVAIGILLDKDCQKLYNKIT